MVKLVKITTLKSIKPVYIAKKHPKSLKLLKNMNINLNVNGQKRSTPAEPSTPLLYVLRNDFELNGAKFGCGAGQCGACTVLLDGKPIRSCLTQIKTLHKEAQITTIEGLIPSNNTKTKLSFIQDAFIQEQAAQCGYCINGMIMTAQAFIDKNPSPTESEIREALAANLCRCGTHTRIIKAVLRAAANAKSLGQKNAPPNTLSLTNKAGVV